MSGFLVMLKTNLKLVLRNKASIFLIFLIPFAATMILKVQDKEDDMNSASSKMLVQVFDNSSSEQSRVLINTLKASSSFDIAIHQGSTEDINSAKLDAANIANKSRANGIVYIPSNFLDSASKGNLENAVTIFTTGRDGRVKLLQSNINAVLSRFSMYSKAAGGNKEVFEQLLKRAEEHKTTGEVVQISSSGKVLTAEQKTQLHSFGFLVAIMSIALMFSGNFISAIFAEEKNNRVLKRISLTNSSMFNYGMVKFVVSLAVLIIQVVMISMGIKLFVKLEVNINIVEIAVLILGLGMIFNTLSIALGAILENLGSANYITFLITTISSLMAGLYFPLEIAPKWIQNAALLMPQRWVVRTAEQILLGSGSAIFLFMLVVIGYMAVFLTTSFLGLKLNSNKIWYN